MTHRQHNVFENSVRGTGHPAPDPRNPVPSGEYRLIRRGTGHFVGGIACESGLTYYGLRRALGVPCAGEPGDPRAIVCFDADHRTASREVRPLAGVAPVRFPPGMLNLLPRHTVGEVRAFCGKNEHMRPVASHLAGIDPAARTDEGGHACPAITNALFNVYYAQNSAKVMDAVRHSRYPETIARAADHGLNVDSRPGLHFVVANGCSATGPGGLPAFLASVTNACHELGAEHDEIVPIIIGPLANTAGDRTAVHGIFWATLVQVLKGFLEPSKTKIRTPSGIITPQRPWFTRAYIVDGATTDFSFTRTAVPHIVAEFLYAQLDQPQGRAALDSWFVDTDGDVDLVGDTVGPRVWGRFGMHVYRVDPGYAARRLRTALRGRLAHLLAPVGQENHDE